MEVDYLVWQQKIGKHLFEQALKGEGVNRKEAGNIRYYFRELGKEIIQENPGNKQAVDHALDLMNETCKIPNIVKGFQFIS